MSDWETDNIFRGTAFYYSKFRPGYPPEAFDLLVDRFSLNKKSRVLDLGCGTGQIAIKIAPYVSEVIAIDPLEEMLREGKSLASGGGIINIVWNLGESANLSQMASIIGEIDLTVIARAFHWMEREQTLRDLYAITKRGGGLVIVTHTEPRSPPFTKWKSAIDDTVHYWLGNVRKAGTKGIFTPPSERFEKNVEESRFENQKSVKINTKRTWTIDEIIGYLYSLSSSSIPVLGDKKEPFEADIRRRLTDIEPSGVFEEEVTTEILMAWKP